MELKLRITALRWGSTISQPISTARSAPRPSASARQRWRVTPAAASGTCVEVGKKQLQDTISNGADASISIDAQRESGGDRLELSRVQPIGGVGALVSCLHATG